MNILQNINSYIKEFNIQNSIDLDIDSIRVDFNKQHKKERLDKIGKWNKLNKNDKTIVDKLKNKLTKDKITNVYQLEKYNIYFYNLKDKPKYRKATMVIFGLKQYHKTPPPYFLVETIISILKSISNIDVCLDIGYKPNITNLNEYFELTPYKHYNNTHYINKPNIPMIDKVVVYDKKKKNNLDFECYRVEATISIPNIKYLDLPLSEFKKEIIDLI